MDWQGRCNWLSSAWDVSVKSKSEVHFVFYSNDIAATDMSIVSHDWTQTLPCRSQPRAPIRTNGRGCPEISRQENIGLLYLYNPKTCCARKAVQRSKGVVQLLYAFHRVQPVARVPASIKKWHEGHWTYQIVFESANTALPYAQNKPYLLSIISAWNSNQISQNKTALLLSNQSCIIQSPTLQLSNNLSIVCALVIFRNRAEKLIVAYWNLCCYEGSFDVLSTEFHVPVLARLWWWSNDCLQGNYFVTLHSCDPQPGSSHSILFILFSFVVQVLENASLDDFINDLDHSAFYSKLLL
jgi:hypothetical protein